MRRWSEALHPIHHLSSIYITPFRFSSSLSHSTQRLIGTRDDGDHGGMTNSNLRTFLTQARVRTLPPAAPAHAPQFNASAPPVDMSASALIDSLRVFLCKHARLCGLDDDAAAAMAAEAVVQGDGGVADIVIAIVVSSIFIIISSAAAAALSLSPPPSPPPRHMLQEVLSTRSSPPEGRRR